MYIQNYYYVPYVAMFRDIVYKLIEISHQYAAEHRASTGILLLTLFLASVLISAQVFLTPLASSSTVLRHVHL